MHPLCCRILCVDDHEDSREMMKILLRHWNYDVAVASNAIEGKRLAETEHFDVFLLDTHLPEVSGYDLCEQLCTQPEHPPVVFLSAAAYDADKERGIQAGAIAYLTKPVDFETLEITLTQLCPQINGQEL